MKELTKPILQEISHRALRVIRNKLDPEATVELSHVKVTKVEVFGSTFLIPFRIKGRVVPTISGRSNGTMEQLTNSLLDQIKTFFRMKNL